MTEQQQLEAAISALEDQRSALGDAVVESLLSAARAKLAALTAAAAVPPAPAQTLKQVSILFLDVVGSTALSQHLDPEGISAVMDDALSRGTAIVQAHGGKVLQYAGDNILAVFGADEAREDDAERAVRCGLSLLELGRALGAEVRIAHGHDTFNVRVGVHTGGVLLGGGVDADGSIRGIAVNIAARMEQTAPAGALRISHDTYAQVRGMFEVEVQPPQVVKGVDEPIPSYLVLSAKARSFRLGSRGIEGVATRMIGRDAELGRCKPPSSRCSSIASSLWSAWWPTPASARAGCSTSSRPGARCARSASLSSAVAPRRRRKASLSDSCATSLPGASRLPTTTASKRRVARWSRASSRCSSTTTVPSCRKAMPTCSAIWSASSGVTVATSRASSTTPGRSAIAPSTPRHSCSAASSLSDGSPVVLELEDLHWADNESLDFLAYLAETNRDVPLLIVACCRPTLFERRANWCTEGVEQRLDLQPLGKDMSRLLVGELLKKLPEVPVALRELITGGAEGNPFYMEELVKMLIDQGAIATGEVWKVNAERLLLTKVPTTLVGVLQARLDGLPVPERLTLQNASVIGSVFWDRALFELDTKANHTLPSLVRRELTVPREDSTTDDLREYTFKHQILHQVTYATVLKVTRRDLHGKLARWLAAQTGLRAK